MIESPLSKGSFVPVSACEEDSKRPLDQRTLRCPHTREVLVAEEMLIHGGLRLLLEPGQQIDYFSSFFFFFFIFFFVLFYLYLFLSLFLL